ncbi:hypothetical protein L2E82_51171 [Cichorium intybus]|nr:hypothetical protein L2E82_51171 [Cichorium intybus]
MDTTIEEVDEDMFLSKSELLAREDVLKRRSRKLKQKPGFTRIITDWNILQFEDGYLVETVVEGNQLGVVLYSIRVSQDGELYAVDAVNSNIV